MQNSDEPGNVGSVSATADEKEVEKGASLAGKRSRSASSADGDDSIEGDPKRASPSSKRASPSSDDDHASSKRKAEGYGDLLESLSPVDRRKFIAADSRRRENDRNVIAAHSHVVKVRGEFHRLQAELQKAQEAYDKATALSEEHSEQDADNLLLGPCEWNSRYLQLKTYFDREGHSHLKRNISDSDVESMTESEATEFRALSRWASRQRKSKRSGELEHYKVLLLNRLNFDWDPKTGHGPEKWLKQFELLKEFHQKHGHVKVPMQYGDEKLGLWVKTQLTLYRNGKEGKLPSLSAERIRMLEELGITWGERRKGIPWEERFQALLDYKNRFGHCHVPWQWKENVGLAQWVNTQRKKYKDMKDGKKNNLSDAQINMLNSIGFKWSTGGKGRYVVESPADDQPGMAATSTAVPSPPATSSASSVLNQASVANTVAAVAAASPSLATTMANIQQGFAQVNQAQSEIASAMAGSNSNNNTNYLGSLLSGLGGTTTTVGQQQLAPAAQPALQLQQLLLNQQLIQQAPSGGITSLLNEQASTVQALQQLINNQQPQPQPQPSSLNIAAAAVGAPHQPTPQSDSLSQVYSRLINQQAGQSIGNTIGTQQAADQNTMAIFQLQQLLGQQSDQQSANNKSS